jgi:hypothetical protein
MAEIVGNQPDFSDYYTDPLDADRLIDAGYADDEIDTILAKRVESINAELGLTEYQGFEGT